MAMIGPRDKPAYYRIIDRDGRVHANAPKSKVLRVKRDLERKLATKLSIELIEEKPR